MLSPRTRPVNVARVAERRRRAVSRAFVRALRAVVVVVVMLPAVPAIAAPLDLSRDATFRADGAAAGDNAGIAVAAAGDVNGDGHDDIVVGAPFADNNGRSESGSVYVLFGPAAPGSVDL